MRKNKTKERNDATGESRRSKASFCCLLRLRAPSTKWYICNVIANLDILDVYSICNIIRDDDAVCDYDNFPLRELRADANTSADFSFLRGWKSIRVTLNWEVQPMMDSLFKDMAK